jgi:hypothetical protein
MYLYDYIPFSVIQYYATDYFFVKKLPSVENVFRGLLIPKGHQRETSRTLPRPTTPVVGLGRGFHASLKSFDD